MFLIQLSISDRNNEKKLNFFAKNLFQWRTDFGCSQVTFASFALIKEKTRKINASISEKIF